jgi:hypothetical protein
MKKHWSGESYLQMTTTELNAISFVDVHVGKSSRDCGNNGSEREDKDYATWGNAVYVLQFEGQKEKRKRKKKKTWLQEKATW